MENRIERKDDESLYQPKIHSQRIRTLYQLKQGSSIDRENKLLDLVNYHAQRAILSDLPEEKKVQVVNDAIHSIQSIAERKATYLAENEEGEKTRKPR